MGGCIPTLVTLTLISSDNPLPSDQPGDLLRNYIEGTLLESSVCTCGARLDQVGQEDSDRAVGDTKNIWPKWF